MADTGQVLWGQSNDAASKKCSFFEITIHSLVAIIAGYHTEGGYLSMPRKWLFLSNYVIFQGIAKSAIYINSQNV